MELYLQSTKPLRHNVAKRISHIKNYKPESCYILFTKSKHLRKVNSSIIKQVLNKMLNMS